MYYVYLEYELFWMQSAFCPQMEMSCRPDPPDPIQFKTGHNWTLLTSRLHVHRSLKLILFIVNVKPKRKKTAGYQFPFGRKELGPRILRQRKLDVFTEDYSKDGQLLLNRRKAF